MAIVPHPRAPIHTPTLPFTGRRWPSRVYPGDLAQTSWVRSDLAVDLARLAGLAKETGEDIVLCASEMFANACDHSRSGQDPEGRGIRTLNMPTATTVQVAIVDDGVRADSIEPKGPEIEPEPSGFVLAPIHVSPGPGDVGGQGLYVAYGREGA